ncbi:MAG: efflux RND transporter permease subunit [Planctomycetes bacterium]|nr:efflux RND transporter permease subunit [Planctomycetota bacterium]
MNALLRFSVKNPVGVNLIFLAILVVGWIQLGKLPREVFPEFAKDTVEVTVVYANASPDEVARLCVVPLEEAADGVQGTAEISSISTQESARIFIRLYSGTDVQAYLDELRQEVDLIEDWPEDAEDPRIFEQKMQFPVITISLFGNLAETETKQIAERLRDQVKAVPNVSSVTLLGVRDPELRVEIRPADLERYGLSLADVSRSLGAQVLDLPGGSLETPAGETLLRVLGEEADPQLLAARVVRGQPDGSLVRLGDLATVRRGFERALTVSRYNGYETIALQVAKDPQGDVIDIVDSVRGIVEEVRPSLPEGVSIGLSSDFSVYVKNRLSTLLQSGFFGLALVLIVLWVFLDARTALMTAVGIPVAVMGGVIAMSLLGITMNMLSMFAFILVLGLVVDDAIVVVENCFRYVEKGFKPMDAALLGAREVAWPVVTTIATTVAAFSAILLIDGELGQWMKPVPWVASLTLVASLIEALIVLPSHFSEWIRPIGDSVASEEAALISQPKERKRWYDGLQRFYERSLDVALRHRYPSLLAAAGALLIAAGLFQFGHLKFVLLPKFEAKLFMVNVEGPTSSSLEQTFDTLRHFEDHIAEMPAHELESYVSLAGANYSDAQNYKVGANLGQVFVELAEGGARTRTTEEIQASLRESFGAPPGVLRIDFTAPQAGPQGKPIEMWISGPEADMLAAASAEVQTFLAGFAGVRDIRDDLLPGAREIRFRLTDEGRLQGFSEALLARQVLGAFYGDRATILRLGGDPANLLVRLPEAARLDFAALRTLRVQSPLGEWVEVRRVAELVDASGLAQVTRRDRQRSITITADVTAEGNAREVMQQVIAQFGDIGRRYPGTSITYGGDQEATRESMESLVEAMALSFLIIYFLLAFLFRSYTQPVVVLASVPFGALGVFYGFAFIGEPLSFMTMLGVLALSGVAVNDALVLVDFVNQHRREGHTALESVKRAGAVRMRPVVITSMTTIGGLMPLAFFSSGQARFLAPMAMALVFGMASATLMTLVLVPVGYMVLEDLKRFAHWIVGPLTRRRTGLT